MLINDGGGNYYLCIFHFSLQPITISINFSNEGENKFHLALPIIYRDKLHIIAKK